MQMRITEEEVRAYLSDGLDDAVIVTSLHQTFPGMSRETWMVSGHYSSGEPFQLVIRVTPPNGGNSPIPLRTEYEVYRRLADSPVPVGEVLWFNEDIEFAQGRSHMVRVMVEGDTEVPGVRDPGPEGDRVREHVAREHASKLATLHTLDWRAYGFDEIFDPPPSGDDADALRNEFKTWKGYWYDKRTDPLPMITEALYWFEEHVPTDGVRISLTKGNNGLGEEIWRDGQIVAMSDWELAGLGDPALDWAFSQGMLDLWDRDKLLNYYAELSGYVISPTTLAFCQLWTSFKAVVCLNPSLRPFCEKRDQRPVMASLGLGASKNTERMFASIIDIDDVEEAYRLVQSGVMGARR